MHKTLALAIGPEMEATLAREPDIRAHVGGQYRVRYGEAYPVPGLPAMYLYLIEVPAPWTCVPGVQEWQVLASRDRLSAALALLAHLTMQRGE